jgi:hypothetical protein|tara:strand:+ start:4819 stop:4938 length:120 start_codon:yes stop_codon:yes gene_type:complete
MEKSGTLLKSNDNPDEKYEPSNDEAGDYPLKSANDDVYH